MRFPAGRQYDLTGQAFNSWLVIERAEILSRKSHWLCQCTGCDMRKVIDGYNLRSGRSKSCRKCSAAVVMETAVITHGQSRTMLYVRWQGIKTRCTNPKAKSWKYYGGRGISVCEEWMDSFEAFAAYMGEPPTPRHTIDRWPDNNGNYEPGNVRWATPHEQMANTRNGKPFKPVRWSAEA